MDATSSVRSQKHWLKPALLLVATVALYLYMMSEARHDMCNGGAIFIVIGPFVLGLGIWSVVCIVKAMRSAKSEMLSKRVQVFVWFCLFGIGLAVSNGFHPTLLINLLASTLLTAGFVSIIYLNHLVFIPHLFRLRKYWGY